MTKNTIALGAILTILLISGTSFAQQETQEGTQGNLDEIIVIGKYLSIDKVNAVKTPTPIIANSV